MQVLIAVAEREGRYRGRDMEKSGKVGDIKGGVSSKVSSEEKVHWTTSVVQHTFGLGIRASSSNNPLPALVGRKYVFRSLL